MFSKKLKYGLLVLSAILMVSTFLMAGSGKWTRLGLGAGPVEQLVVDPESPMKALAGTGAGLFMTENGGRFWTPVSGVPSERVDALARSGRSCVAIVQKKLFRSEDFGHTWLEARIPSENPVSLIGISGSKSVFLFQDAFSSAVCRSEDGGRTWTSADGAFGLYENVVEQEGILYEYYNLSGKMYFMRSPDLGINWQQVTSLNNTTCFTLTSVPGMSGCLLASTSRGLMRTVDGGKTWNVSEDGIPNDNVTSMQPIEGLAGSVVASASYGGSSITSDGGVTWSPLAHTDRWIGPNVQQALKDGHIWVSTEQGLFRSDDFGRTWIEASGNLKTARVYTLEADPHHPHEMIATSPDGRLFRRGADGNWLTSVGKLFDNTLKSISVSPADPDRIYATSWYAKAYRSDDGGKSWRSISSFPSWPGCILSLANSPDCALVLSNAGLFRTADGGGTWRRVVEPVTSYIKYSSLSRVGKNIYLGIPGGAILVSKDDGLTWTGFRNRSDSGVLIAGDPANPARLVLLSGRQAYFSEDSGANFQQILTMESSMVKVVNVMGKFWLINDKNRLYQMGDTAASACEAATLPWKNTWDMIPDPSRADAVLVLSEEGIERVALGGQNPVAEKLPAPRGLRLLAGASGQGKAQIIAAGLSGFHCSKDGGVSWSTDTDGSAPVWLTALAADPNSPDKLVAGTSAGSLFLSTDGGKSWNPFGWCIEGANVEKILIGGKEKKLLIAKDNYPWVTVMNPDGTYCYIDSEMTGNGPNRIASWGESVVGTTDNLALDYLSFPSGSGNCYWVAGQGNFGHSIYTMLATPGDKPRLYIAGEDKISTLDGRLKNRELPWFISTLFGDAGDPNHIGGLFGDRAGHSMDAGETWGIPTSGWSWDTVRAGQGDPGAPGSMLVGGDTGLWTITPPAGDLDGSGRVDSMDAVLLANWMCGNEAARPIDLDQADFQLKGSVNLTDLIRLKVSLQKR